MRKRFAAIIVGALLVVGMLVFAGCSSNGNDTSSDEESSNEAVSSTAQGQINVYSREDGSGTRDAFTELFGIVQDVDGQDVDMTTLDAAITNSTSVMMTSVAGDENAIGYISLGSLSDMVKALQIDGVDATADNVKSGSYAISRPFNLVINDDLSDAAQDFMDYILSSDGQQVIEENGYVGVADDADAYTTSGASGKVVVAGSSSVTPVMEKLAEAYEALNPDVSIEVQQSDSTTGINMAIEGTADIGMASRDLKDTETDSGVSSTPIALDGIAVIVSPDSSIDGLTSDQVMEIFTGEITDWSEIA
ncbi:MAG: extracellular solute-binding protein [Eggerthellaceae bacterium]|nr:extracellular solute-binding protein [Eggerthellaceae bacterium]